MVCIQREFILLALTVYRPLSKHAQWEEPPQEGERFDPDAEPDRFYFEVEGVGNLEPDRIIHEGVRVLQKKLAAIIKGLSDSDGKSGQDDYIPQDPDVNMGGQGYEPGYTTPGYAPNYGNGAGAATPYGATPYGQSGY